jgi:hypothetical protein
MGSPVVPDTWDEARRGLSDDDQKEFTDELRDRMVRDWARKLKRAFGNKAAANGDILADAIEHYSASLPIELITNWRQNGLEPSFDDLWGGDY